MKKWIALAIGIIIFLVLFITVLAGDEEEQCEDGSTRPGQRVSTSVPAGEFANPETMPPAQLTSGYGERWGTFHYGQDIATGLGTPIYAFADGTVTNAGPATGFGQWIVIQHNIDGQRVDTVYGHMYPDDMFVSVGDQVRAGQHIANEGANGEVTGPHLHFEVHPGGWAAHGAVDPAPWLAQAHNVAKDGGVDKVTPDAGDVDVPNVDGSLPPVDSYEGLTLVGGEDKLQVNTIRGARVVAAVFHDSIDVIGGWRANGGGYGDHPEGRAIDIMIPNYQSSEGKALGDEIKDWLFERRHELNIDYMLWQQTYIPSEGEGNLMEDRGSDSENHFNHVHVTFLPSDYAHGDETYDMPSGTSGGSYKVRNGCGKHGGHSHMRQPLADGTVPDGFAPWFNRGAQVCDEIDAPLLAAQMQAESNFTPNLVSGAKAMGYSQFIPETWATYGYKVDANGEQISGPGEGDPNNIGDAVMAQAHYMCDLLDTAHGRIDRGQWQGVTPVEGALGAYNAGAGNMDKFGGIPTDQDETSAYVAKIMQNKERFAGL